MSVYEETYHLLPSMLSFPPADVARCFKHTAMHYLVTDSFLEPELHELVHVRVHKCANEMKHFVGTSHAY